MNISSINSPHPQCFYSDVAFWSDCDPPGSKWWTCKTEAIVEVTLQCYFSRTYRSGFLIPSRSCAFMRRNHDIRTRQAYMGIMPLPEDIPCKALIELRSRPCIAKLTPSTYLSSQPLARSRSSEQASGQGRNQRHCTRLRFGFEKD